MDDVRPTWPDEVPLELRAIPSDCWCRSADQRLSALQLEKRLTAVSHKFARQNSTEADLKRDLGLLPAHVVAKIKAAGKGLGARDIEPETFDETTVAFIDICSFTAFSGKVPAAKVRASAPPQPAPCPPRLN